MRRSVLADFLIYFSCFTGALVCAGLLYYDAFIAKNLHTGLDKAGYMGDKVDNVKRKTSDSMLWDDLDRSDELFWNDAVSTSSTAQAKLELKNGMIIRMASSSLIELIRDENGVNVKMLKGQIAVDPSHATPGAARVKINGKELSKNLNGLMTIDYDKKAGIKATTTGKDGVTSRISVDARGKLKQESVFATLYGPEPLSKITVSGKAAPVSFAWKSKDKKPKLFELAHDKNFKTIVARIKTKENMYRTTLSEGSYFWRVSQIPTFRHPGLSSETRNFFVEQLSTYDDKVAQSSGYLFNSSGFLNPAEEYTVEAFGKAKKMAANVRHVMGKKSYANSRVAARKVPTRSIASVPPPVVAPEPEEAPPQILPPEEQDKGPMNFTITVVKDLESEDDAIKRVNTLRDKGLKSLFYDSYTKGGKTLYKVHSGLFATKEDAAAYGQNISNKSTGLKVEGVDKIAQDD